MSFAQFRTSAVVDAARYLVEHAQLVHAVVADEGLTHEQYEVRVVVVDLVYGRVYVRHSCVTYAFGLRGAGRTSFASAFMSRVLFCMRPVTSRKA